MKKIFVSVGVRNLTQQQTIAKHAEYREKITNIIGEYTDISDNVSSFHQSSEIRSPIYWLGKGLSEELVHADLVVFCGNLNKTRGCQVEKLVCDLYDIPYLVIK